MISKIVRTALVGFGNSGKVFHSGLLKAHPEFHVRKVLTSRPAEVREIFPQAIVVSDLEQILQDREVDLVIICSPTGLHFSQAAAALQNGKHVVVEKPFVSTVAEGEQLICPVSLVVRRQ